MTKHSYETMQGHIEVCFRELAKARHMMQSALQDGLSFADVMIAPVAEAFIRAELEGEGKKVETMRGALTTVSGRVEIRCWL